MNEGRYAVLIGINDYKDKPLASCVNDVNGIKKELLSRCNYSEENIVTITSDSENIIDDVYGKFCSSIYNLKSKIENDGYENNFIFFSFAGHSSRNNDEPFLQFKENYFRLSDIYEFVMKLPTTNRFFLFDCCESEHKGLLKQRGSKTNDSNYINKLIEKSEGTSILFASKENQSAFEDGKNGLLSSTWIKVISDKDNYDKDGILSTEILVSHIKKEFVDNEKQEPVAHYVGTGYYPLSSLSNWNQTLILSENEKKPRGEKKPEQIEKVEINLNYFNYENRKNFQNSVGKYLDELDIFKGFEEYRSNLENNDFFAEKIYKKIKGYNVLKDSISYIKTKKETNNFYATAILNSLNSKYTESFSFEILIHAKSYKLQGQKDFPSTLYFNYLILHVKYGAILVFLDDIVSWSSVNPSFDEIPFKYTFYKIDLQKPISNSQKEISELVSSHIKKLKKSFETEEQQNSEEDIKSYLEFKNSSIGSIIKK